MAWQSTFLDASYNGVPFEPQRVEDIFARALAIHQAPFSNSADINDMGADPTRIAITAYLTGADYEKQRDALLYELGKGGQGELIHPLLGIKKVNVVTYKLLHNDEMVDACSIDMEFVEPLVQKPAQFVPTTTLATTASPAAIVLQQPLSRLQQFEQKMQAVKGLLSKPELLQKIQGGLLQIHQALGMVNSTLTDLSSPTTWVGDLLSDVAQLSFDANMLGDGALANFMFMQRKIKAVGQLFGLSDDPEPLKSMGSVLPLAMSLSVTQALIDQQNATSTSSEQMTPPQLEAVNNAVRLQILQQIQDLRFLELHHKQVDTLDIALAVPLEIATQVNALKQAALIINNQIIALIERKPPLISSNVKQVLCMRVFAHVLYGDHNRADELYRLNSLMQNPALLWPHMQVHHYAK